MLTGKSIYHVEQNLGKAFVPNVLEGYFNDMTLKVLKGHNNIEDGIPFLEHSDGTHVQMPTMIFQYGLGAYDLWIINHDDVNRERFITCADWAIHNQLSNGAWNNFYYIYPDNPYSAMSQGEGISLLLRAYKATNNTDYLFSAKKAVEFMLIDLNMGGVSLHNDNELVFLEYTHLPIVLNGWIFALFGLYDYYICSGEYKLELDMTLKSLSRLIPSYDNRFWSLYDNKGKITSPFYHNLHIAQLKALSLISDDPVFGEYYSKWKRYQKKPINRIRAFVIKAFQKLAEK